MTAYGQVYRTDPGLVERDKGDLPPEFAFRGILMDADHKELWLGSAWVNPDDAFKEMEEKNRFGITDLRKWSGRWPQ